MRRASKKHWKWMLVPTLAAVLILALAGLALAGGPRSGQQAQNASQTAPTACVTPESGVLSGDQPDLILYLLEEEKLAGDVYAELYEVWGARIFHNISVSEDRHAEAVFTLAETYELDTPDNWGQDGVFENEELQILYDQLIEKGTSSLTEAYSVGALIEKTDIEDLDQLLAAGGLPADVEFVANNLRNGSSNHLQAFERQLDR